MQPLIKEGCDGGGRGSTEATAIGNVRRSRSCRLGVVGGDTLKRVQSPKICATMTTAAAAGKVD